MAGKKRRTTKRKPKVKPGGRPGSVKKTAAISPGSSKKLLLGFFILFLVLYGIARLNFLDIPFERDEGDYCLAGQFVLEGKTPYVDFYEQKPPGLFYTYAIIEAIFGKSPKMLHIAFLLLNALTSVLIFFIGKSLFKNTGAAVASGIAFTILSLNQYVMGFTIQSEHLLTLFMVGGFLALIKAFEKEKWWLYCAGGFLVSWSMTIKQNGLFFTLFLGLFLILFLWEKYGDLFHKSLWTKVGLYSAGVVLPLGLLSLAMVAQGSFNDMIFWIYHYPKDAYVSSIPFEKGMEYFQFWLKRISSGYQFFWVIAGLGLIGIWFTGAKKSIKIGLSLFMIFSLGSITPGNRFYGHYWLHLLPAVCILGGAAVYSAGYILKEKLNWLPGKSVVIGIFILAAFATFLSHRSYYFTPDLDAVIRQVYGTNPFPEIKRIADHINQNAAEDDQLVVAGSEPQLHFYTQNMSPSRHTFMAFLVSNHPKESEWRDELKKAIEEAKPRYIVNVWHGMSWAFNAQSDDEILKWFSFYTNFYYRPIAVADMISKGNTKWVWGDDAVGYKAQSQNNVTLFERKSGPSFPGTQN